MTEQKNTSRTRLSRPFVLDSISPKTMISEDWRSAMRRRAIYLAEIATKPPDTGYDNAFEFAWGLDLILDGVDRRRRTTRR